MSATLLLLIVIAVIVLLIWLLRRRLARRWSASISSASMRSEATNRSSTQGKVVADDQKSNHITRSQPLEQRPTTRTIEDYDVFVSYRREHGAETARLIRASLMDRDLRAFLDVDDLRAGHFNEELLTHIANTPNFIVILSPQALDRCADEQDWLTQEIAQAIRTNSNIVPIMMPGFHFPEPQSLPSDIRAVRTYQSISYSHEFFDAMLDRIIRYLQ